MSEQTLTVQLMHANTRIAELEAEVAALKAARTHRPNTRVVPVRAPYQRPAWMETARQAAMSSGKTVLAA